MPLDSVTVLVLCHLWLWSLVVALLLPESRVVVTVKMVVLEVVDVVVRWVKYP